MMKEVEIETGSDTVWVNTAVGCIGRFSRYGIDIHRAFEEQLETGNPRLFCTHTQNFSKLSEDDWQLFREKMKEFHGVDVPDSARPPSMAERAHLGTA